MTEQFITEEIQNKSVIPWVFRVGTGEGEFTNSKAAETAAKAKYHAIMNAVYSANEPYHGAIVLHQYGENPPLIEKYEMEERTASN